MHTQQLIDEFLLSLGARSRTPRTIEAYRQRLRESQRKLPAELEQIQPVDLDGLLYDLRQRGLASATLATYIQTLRTLFSWCVRRGYLASSPALDLHRPKLKQAARRKAIQQGELDKLIGQARREEARLELAALLLLADSGCRAGELLALDLDGLDLPHMEAITTGKTGERTIDFTAPTERALVEWIKVRPETDEQALFTSHSGRMTYDQLYTRLRRLARRAGAKKFGPQSIRHRVGQGWIDAGANLEIVRIKLGHADITTTSKFYAHQDRPRMKAASKKYSLVKG
jgi:site-specific recombinase XerC